MSGLLVLLIVTLAGVIVWAVRSASAAGSRGKRETSSDGQAHWVDSEGGGPRDHGKPYGSSGRDAHGDHTGDGSSDFGGADSGGDSGGDGGGGDGGGGGD